MSLVVVVGAGGQLGDAMASQLTPAHEVVALSRADLDVTDAGAVRATVARIGPDVIVNASAYTNVDGAEREPLAALRVNALAVRTLARAADQVEATLVHFGTDFVFDGDTDRPYRESDAPNPRGAYGTSKLLGEWLAAEAARHYVLRVESLFGGARARSSIDRMLDSLRTAVPVRAFADRAVSPSYVDDVVAATGRLLAGRAPYGLYHCVNTGWTTWAGVARELARLAGRPDAEIHETRMADASAPGAPAALCRPLQRGARRGGRADARLARRARALRRPPRVAGRDAPGFLVAVRGNRVSSGGHPVSWVRQPPPTKATISTSAPSETIVVAYWARLTTIWSCSTATVRPSISRRSSSAWIDIGAGRSVGSPFNRIRMRPRQDR